jgi:hypothetical protein
MSVQPEAAAGEDPQTVVRSAAYRALVEHVRDGRCFLFLGAGVHYPPPENSRYSYPEDQRPPLGADLAHRLAAGCDFDQVVPNEAPTNLQRVSACYEKELSRRELVEEIRRAVDENTKPSAAVRALAEFAFPLVITTNYDTLFETALRHAGKKPHIGVYDPREDTPTADYPPGREPSGDEPFVFKVHGDVGTPESIVVTDEDYIGFVLRMSAAGRFHPIPDTFRYHFARWPTLFVGYSLLDYNLRLLFRTLRWKVDVSVHPESYSVDLKPDPLIRHVWQGQQRFRFIAEDVWFFVPRLYRDVFDREMPV